MYEIECYPNQQFFLVIRCGVIFKLPNFGIVLKMITSPTNFY